MASPKLTTKRWHVEIDIEITTIPAYPNTAEELEAGIASALGEYVGNAERITATEVEAR